MERVGNIEILVGERKALLEAFQTGLVEVRIVREEDRIDYVVGQEAYLTEVEGHIGRVGVRDDLEGVLEVEGRADPEEVHTVQVEDPVEVVHIVQEVVPVEGVHTVLVAWQEEVVHTVQEVDLVAQEVVPVVEDSEVAKSKVNKAAGYLTFHFQLKKQEKVGDCCNSSFYMSTWTSIHFHTPSI